DERLKVVFAAVEIDDQGASSAIDDDGEWFRSHRPPKCAPGETGRCHAYVDQLRLRGHKSGELAFSIRGCRDDRHHIDIDRDDVDSSAGEGYSVRADHRTLPPTIRLQLQPYRVGDWIRFCDAELCRLAFGVSTLSDHYIVAVRQSIYRKLPVIVR